MVRGWHPAWSLAMSYRISRRDGIERWSGGVFLVPVYFCSRADVKHCGSLYTLGTRLISAPLKRTSKQAPIDPRLKENESSIVHAGLYVVSKMRDNLQEARRIEFRSDLLKSS